MKIKNAQLEVVAGFADQFPNENLAEIALAGRSNVGKSSFINALLQRKNLAKTSSKPGKTRTVNFYNINNDFRLVDLPGYGYAKASKKEMDKWADLINEYLSTRPNLYEVFLIVDARHEPTDQDLQMYDWIIESGFTGYIIATKVDKIGKSKIDQVKKRISEKLDTDRDLIINFSSEKPVAKDRIVALLDKILEYEIVYDEDIIVEE